MTKKVLVILCVIGMNVLAFGERVNVKDFGAIPNDGKDDTEAIEKAVQFANKLTRSFRPPSSSNIGCAPTVYFPSGHYHIKRQIGVAGTVGLCSDNGKAIIEWIDDLSIAADKKAAMFLFGWCYTSAVRNLKFIGGNTQLQFQNPNIDKTVIDISGCEFYLAKGFSIRAVPVKEADHLSALLTIRNCKFVGNYQCVETYCDMTRITDTWVSVEGPITALNRAAFVNTRGRFIMDNMVGVPGICKDREVMKKPHQLRWVDNYGTFEAVRTRFGGEGAGMPIVYNYTKNNRKYPYMGGAVISITQSWVCAGSKRKDACIIRLFTVPSVVVLRENTHMVNAPIIRVDPSLNIDDWLKKVPVSRRNNFVYVIKDNYMFPPSLMNGIPEQLRQFFKDKSEYWSK